MRRKGARARGKREWEGAWRERDGTGERGREGGGGRRGRGRHDVPSVSPLPFRLLPPPPRFRFPSPKFPSPPFASSSPPSLLFPSHLALDRSSPLPLPPPPLPSRPSFSLPPLFPPPSVLLAPSLSSPAGLDVPRLRDPLSFPQFLYSRVVQASVP